MDKEPSESPEDEARRLIAEAKERVQPLYDHMLSMQRAVSPARVAIDHYLELAAQRDKLAPTANESSNVVDVPLPEDEDKV